MNVSRKHGDENLFSYFLNAKETDWLYIQDEEAGCIYEGWVQSFSESEAIQELVLTDVKVYEYSTSKPLYEAPAIYISKPHGKFVIELTSPNQMGDSNEENDID